MTSREDTQRRRHTERRPCEAGGRDADMHQWDKEQHALPAITRARRQARDRFSPMSTRRSQSSQHLDFKLLASELWDNKFLLVAPQLVRFCFSSPRNQTHKSPGLNAGYTRACENSVSCGLTNCACFSCIQHLNKGVKKYISQSRCLEEVLEKAISCAQLAGWIPLFCGHYLPILWKVLGEEPCENTMFRNGHNKSHTEKVSITERAHISRRTMALS